MMMMGMLVLIGLVGAGNEFRPVRRMVEVMMVVVRVLTLVMSVVRRLVMMPIVSSGVALRIDRRRRVSTHLLTTTGVTVLALITDVSRNGRTVQLAGVAGTGIGTASTAIVQSMMMLRLGAIMSNGMARHCRRRAARGLMTSRLLTVTVLYRSVPEIVNRVGTASAGHWRGLFQFAMTARYPPAAGHFHFAPAYLYRLDA